MKLVMILQLLTLLTVAQQGASSPDCVCELKNLDKPFPHDKLRTVEDSASTCNEKYTQQKIQDIDILLLALKHRMPQLEAMVAELEKEDDGDLYGAITLQVIENEQAEILKFIQQLSNTTEGTQLLNTDTEQKLQEMKEEMGDLQTYDSMQVVKRDQANTRLKRDLDQCRNEHPTAPPTQPPQGNCPLGHMVNVTGPRVTTVATSAQPRGAWGRDPKPEAGKESWYWLVMLTSSNIYANYVRRFSSLSGLIVGASSPGNVQISPSNPTTNTIQGPNAVLYGEALYYGCYNKDAVCRFNLTDRSVTSVQLPKGTRFNSQSNFCIGSIGQCYSYTDLDLATDESGIWVIYATSENFGNVVLSKVEPGKQPTLGQTWHTSLYKQAATNTFVACGMLYATRYVSSSTEEIFYSFDTTTGVERYDVGIHIQKMAANIYSLNYSPVDHMLYVYNDGKMVSYEVEFE